MVAADLFLVDRYFADGTLAGVYLGDEIAANGMPFDDLQRYINLVRGILDGIAVQRHPALEPLILYYCTSTYASLWPRIPSNLTHLALDDCKIVILSRFACCPSR